MSPVPRRSPQKLQLQIRSGYNGYTRIPFKNMQSFFCETRPCWCRERVNAELCLPRSQYTINRGTGSEPQPGQMKNKGSSKNAAEKQSRRPGAGGNKRASPGTSVRPVVKSAANGRAHEVRQQQRRSCKQPSWSKTWCPRFVPGELMLGGSVGRWNVVLHALNSAFSVVGSALECFHS